MESAVRLTVRGLVASDVLLGLFQEHLRYLEPYSDHVVRTHLELARADEGFYAHLQLTLLRGDVLRVHVSEHEEPGYSSPRAALTATFAQAIAQLARARSTLPPAPRSATAWTRV